MDGWPAILKGKDIKTFRNYNRRYFGMDVFTWEIPDYINNQCSIDGIRFYLNIKRFGNPYSEPWPKWPYWVMDLYDALEEVFNGAN